jgi:hydroxyacylglutathione hydrolase
MLDVTPVRAFQDNYIWLIHGLTDPRRVAVVDPGDAAPVLEALDRDGLELGALVITHHHGDHTGGVRRLLERAQVPVYGPVGERIPGRTVDLSDGDTADLEALGLRFEVIDVPGHTAGHIAYYGHGALFCGDTLFSGGCGRLFEGTPAQMTASLDRLAVLPAATRVYCAHEYTLSNLRFAAAVEPRNAALSDYAARAGALRAEDRPTLPSTLGLEREINPFLRCDQPDVVRAAETHSGTSLNDRVEVFATVRAWKDGFG